MEPWSDAARHFDDALATNERIGARPWLAHTQLDYAHMLVGRDAHDDRERVQGLLEKALAAYRELGMEIYAATAAALAQEARTAGSG
jgi:hypothetical protein